MERGKLKYIGRKPPTEPQPRSKRKRGVVIWLTGLPCSGKTTIGRALYKRIRDSVLLDGDELRQELSPDLGFTPEERSAHLDRVRGVAQVLLRQKKVVICAFVSPCCQMRESLRKRLKPFVEVFVDASAEECARRDVKGMWKKAAEGEIENFTGFDSDYEAPEKPDVHIKTEGEGPTQSTNHVVEYLAKKGHV